MALAAAPGVAETQAVGAVKELVQLSFAAWLLDPDRQLEIVDSDVAASESPTISAAHAVVELVLSSQDPAVARAILPELDTRLRRSADFLELYSPLRLSEEADLIVAKVNGQRTAGEIAGRSPHGHDEVLNLLAALVAAGMLEPAPAEEAVEVPAPVAVDEPPARRSPPRRRPRGRRAAPGAAPRRRRAPRRPGPSAARRPRRARGGAGARRSSEAPRATSWP